VVLQNSFFFRVVQNKLFLFLKFFSFTEPYLISVRSAAPALDDEIIGKKEKYLKAFLLPLEFQFVSQSTNDQLNDIISGYMMGFFLN
jgi:hypothetical protein